MKSAFLLSEVPGVFEAAAAFLRSLGAKSAADVVQLTDADGRLFTLYAHRNPETEWEFRDPPYSIETGVTCPDLQRVTAMVAECRWDEWFVSLVEQLARELDAPLWVLDTDGRLWDADAIDVARLVL